MGVRYVIHMPISFPRDTFPGVRQPVHMTDLCLVYWGLSLPCPLYPTIPRWTRPIMQFPFPTLCLVTWIKDIAQFSAWELCFDLLLEAMTSNFENNSFFSSHSWQLSSITPVPQSHFHSSNSSPVSAKKAYNLMEAETRLKSQLHSLYIFQKEFRDNQF